MSWRRGVAAMLGALAMLAMAGSARAGYLDALLAYDTPLWPGKLVRLAEGPATGGAWSTPTVGDVTGDGVPDLIVGSAYGDVIVYPGRKSGPYGPPQSLLTGGEPEMAPKMRPVMPTMMTRPGGRGLLIVIDGRAVFYEASENGVTGGVEITGAGGASLQDVIGRAGGGPVISAAAEGSSTLIVGDTDGRVWRCTIGEDGNFADVAPLTGTKGKQVKVGAPAYVALGKVDGAERLLIGAGRSLWSARMQNGEAAGLRRVTDAVKTPEGLVAERLAPAITPTGRVLLGTRWGPVLDARLHAGTVDDVKWALASSVPVDVGLCAAPWAVDWNGDGLEDLVVGSADGRVRLLIARNDGFFDPPILLRDDKGPIELVTGGPYSCVAPMLADMNGDGKYDLIVGGADGALWAWENKGGAFVSHGRVTVGGDEFGGKGFARATPLDWELEGKTDLIVGRAPVPVDDSISLPAARKASELDFLQNEAPRGKWAKFTKAVPVDVMAEHGGTLGDASYIEPWQVLFPGKVKVGAQGMVLARSGEYLFRLTAGGPYYPRLIGDAPNGSLRAWRPRGPVWATCMYGDKLVVGLAAYGFLGMTEMPTEERTAVER